MSNEIQYSKSFRDFLKKSDCRIAKFLYAINRKYESKSKYTVLPEHYKELVPTPHIYNVYRDGTFEYYYKWESNLLTTKEANYITFRMDGSISYLPAGKSTDNPWQRADRQSAKPAKVLRKILTKRAQKFFTDKDFEQFANSYKAEFSEGNYTFTETDRIKDTYDRNRESGGGSLNSSCMNGDSSYLDIYEDCDQCNILTLINKDGLLSGRCLIWKGLDYKGKKVTLLDRFYVAQDHYYEMFISYAEAKGYWYKKHYKTFDIKDKFINDKGEEVETSFKIYTNTDHGSFPYIDTFSYGGNGWLSNANSSAFFYEYNETNGTRSGEDEDSYESEEVYSAIYGRRLDINDAVEITAGSYTYINEYVEENDTLSFNGETWCVLDDRFIVEVNGKHYHKYDIDNICYAITDSEDNREYRLTEDCSYAVDTDNWYLTELLIEVNGDYYTPAGIVLSNIHGYIPKANAIEVNGEIHLRSDFKNQLNLFEHRA